MKTWSTSGKVGITILKKTNRNNEGKQPSASFKNIWIARIAIGPLRADLFLSMPRMAREKRHNPIAHVGLTFYRIWRNSSVRKSQPPRTLLMNVLPKAMAAFIASRKSSNLQKNQCSGWFRRSLRYLGAWRPLASDGQILTKCAHKRLDYCFHSRSVYLPFFAVLTCLGHKIYLINSMYFCTIQRCRHHNHIWIGNRES
jgi:hypothetical protein